MRRRNAFTLVELLVSMALILFIMAILSGAFVAATGTFRNLKATGDLANKLRAVTTLLQRDLAADHFEGKKRLSNVNFWSKGPPQQGFFRIYQGSAGITETNDSGNPIADSSGIYSYRSHDHALAFTIKVRGDQMSDYLTAGSQGGGAVLGALTNFGPAEARYQPAGSFNFQWGEVTWFLQPQIDPGTGAQDTTVAALDEANVTNAAVPLWTLYRSQRLAVPDASAIPAQPSTSLPLFLEMSCWPDINTNHLFFNTPMDLTVPMRRFDMSQASTAGLLATPPYYPTLTQQGATGTLSGSDLQVTDVVSFDVRMLVSFSTTGVSATAGRVDPFVTLYDPIFLPYQTFQSNGGPVPVNPAFNPATGPLVFDTWSNVVDSVTGQPIDYSQWNVPGTQSSIPLWHSVNEFGEFAATKSLPAPIVLALQITIRLWDPKTNRTREVTLVQAM